MRDLRFLGVLICFLLSGFAGLLYETVWTREFSFAFGTSSIAVATVLAAYMGGLATGAALIGRFLDRIRRPLLWYGFLELGIGASALAVPFAVEWAGTVRAWLLGGLPDLPPEGGLETIGFYGVFAFLTLMIPTALMGATLPLLARQVVRAEEHIGRRIGVLYAINTAGAVLGTLSAAFWLIPKLGLLGTTWVGAAVNGGVLLIAVLLTRGAETVASEDPGTVVRASGPRAFLLIAAGAGISSFMFEVMWTRMIEHVLGASVYAFSTMLASFLLGIALGGALATRLARSSQAAARWLAWSQLGAGLLTFAAYHWVQTLPSLAAELAEAGTVERLVLLALRAGLVLLPGTICIGATFPLAVRALAQHEREAGNASARVYSWNTLGAIIGSVAAGFFIIPWLGFEGTLLVCVGTNLMLAGTAAWLATPASRGPMFAAVAVGAAIAIVGAEPPWPLLRHHAFGESDASGEERNPVIFYRSGRASTVILSEWHDDRGWRLFTNGLPESFIAVRGETPPGALIAPWMTTLPMLSAVETKRLLVVGFGGGVVVEAVPASVQEIDVIELEAEVLEANRLISAERNIDPFADPRVRTFVNDARGALRLTDRRWDAIVSQPSHPWTAGASHLFTEEFAEIVKDHLEPGGLFVQWIGAAFLDEELLRSLSATLNGAFANVRLYEPQRGALLFAASDGALPDHEGLEAAIRAHPDAFGRLRVAVAEDIEAIQLLDEAGTRRLAGDAAPVRDNDNVLATRSPMVMGGGSEMLSQRVDNLKKLLGRQASVPKGADLVYLARQLGRLRQRERAEKLFRAISHPGEREAARGEYMRAAGQVGESRRHYRRSLELDDRSDTARFLLATALRERGAQSDIDALTEGLSPPGLRVFEALALADLERWDDLAGLDDSLARIDVRHVAFEVAADLRIEWRLRRSSETSAAAEAFELLERRPGVWAHRHEAGRALAAARAGRTDAAVFSVRVVAHALIGSDDAAPLRLPPIIVSRVLEALTQIPDGAFRAGERAQIEEALRPLLGDQRKADPAQGA